MASLKKALTFYVLVEANGVDKTITINFATDPVGFVHPGSANQLSEVFSALPMDVPNDSLSCDLSVASSSYDSITKILTVTFTSAGTDDTLHVLAGTALY